MIALPVSSEADVDVMEIAFSGNESSGLHRSNDYVLNIDKSLRKKLVAAYRASVSYSFTGGGVTAKVDAATFQLFLTAISQFYSTYPVNVGSPECTVSKDKKGHVVQYTYKVKLNGEGLTGYTLNAYTTRSSLLVNGKSVEYFMTTELDKIHSIMNSATYNNEPVDTASLNRLLQEQLKRLLDAAKGDNNVPNAAYVDPRIPGSICGSQDPRQRGCKIKVYQM